MADYKTVHEYHEKSDVRFTFSLDDYQIKKLKEYTDFLFGRKIGDIEIYIDNDAIQLFGVLKKVEIEKEAFEEIDESN